MVTRQLPKFGFFIIALLIATGADGQQLHSVFPPSGEVGTTGSATGVSTATAALSGVGAVTAITAGSGAAAGPAGSRPGG